MSAEVQEAKKRLLYCPKCHSRYTYEAAECVACGVPLTDEQPRDFAFFKPLVDVPAVLVAVAFAAVFDDLPGEAQSFGIIFVSLGLLVIAVRRVLDYFEWVGRR